MHTSFYTRHSGLGNTLYCLEKEKHLKILYFGGSVTAGYGASKPDETSWRAKVGKWFSEHFPDAKIDNLNRAVGESGTYLGVFRLQRDVIAHKPDLVFIEYSINDSYYGSSYEKSAVQYETIINGIKTALPYCEIVSVLITDYKRANDALEGKVHTQARAHEDISKKYGIPTIKAGLSLMNFLGEAYQKKWDQYFADIVHPTDLGYQIYYNCIEAFLEETLVKVSCPDKKCSCKLPVTGNNPFLESEFTVLQPNAELLKNSEKMGGKGFSYTDEFFGLHDYYGYFYAERSAESPILIFNCLCTSVALLTNAYTGVTKKEKPWCFEVSVDGGKWEKHCFKSHNPTIIAENLDLCEHIIAFRPVFETFEEADIFKIGILFVEIKKGL